MLTSHSMWTVLERLGDQTSVFGLFGFQRGVMVASGCQLGLPASSGKRIQQWSKRLNPNPIRLMR
jgi:hypothetical protein